MVLLDKPKPFHFLLATRSNHVFVSYCLPTALAGKLMQWSCPSVLLFMRLFPVYLLNRLTFELETVCEFIHVCVS